MSETRTAWWFWGFWGLWKPDAVETWLEDMEQSGWNLVTSDFGANRFRFRRGACRTIRYCIDYQGGKIGGDYHTLFADDGWELVYEGAGWFIWRRPYEGQRPEIYTETRSLVARNRKLVAGLLVLLFLQLAGLYFSVSSMVGGQGRPWDPFTAAACGAFSVLLSVALIMLMRRNRDLERDSGG